MEENKVTSGLSMGLPFSTKNAIEDFLKMEYQEGLRNEFAVAEALINKLSKDTISGKKKYKSFALGITDNVRAVGKSNDRYELGFNDFFNKGVEVVEAEFDTTKLMATFAVTDEAILKGTGDGSLLDVVKDSLDRMQMNLTHTLSRFTYGAHDGLIGAVKSNITKVDLTTVTGTGPRPKYDYPNNTFYPTDANGLYGIPNVVKFELANSLSVLPGMGLQVDVVRTRTTDGTTLNHRLVGRIWQKSNVSILKEEIIFFVDAAYAKTDTYTGTEVTSTSGWAKLNPADTATLLTTGFTLWTNSTTPAANIGSKAFSRQLNDLNAATEAEYHGLQEIVVDADGYPVLFGVDRNVYSSLKPTAYDLEGTKYVTEELLRDMADHIALSTPEGFGINLVAANHKIISSIEKALYQFKEYIVSDQSPISLGRPEIKFDNYTLMKDKFARDNNVYMVDTTKMGELVRRDFMWITSGEKEGVLQRRPGTEMYEGIMNKYADMYVDSFRGHAVIKNAKIPTVGGAVEWYTPNGQ
jgi:hypothetical protein